MSPAPPRNVFLDFEASSLAKASMPIEVAWVFDDGEAESHLIRPAPDWMDWAASAEAIHRIPRARLLAEGDPHDAVARRMIDALGGHALYATAPSWDGQWLSKLLRAAGLPRHALRLEDTVVAHRRVIEATYAASSLPAPDPAVVQAILAAATVRFGRRDPTAHRALADARFELALWQGVRTIAEEHVAHVG